MHYPNTNQQQSKERPARPVCAEILVAGDWLAVCVLKPLHSGACLPSPYLGGDL